MEIIKSTKILLLFRKRLPENNSIEELFNSVCIYLSGQGYDIKRKEVPNPGASLSAICKNIRAVQKTSCSILHITGDIHYAALLSSRPTVITIHDINSALKGNYLKQLFILILWFWLPVLKANRITVISHFSRTQLLKLVPFAKRKTVVIPNPVNPSIYFSPKPFNLTKPRILHIGTKINKNLKNTIISLKGIHCQLMIIGKLSEKHKVLLEENSIDYLNEYHISYEQVIQNYILSDIVLFVSTYEGFGMPIIEAQKIGRPVITSNLSPMKDVAGRGAILVNPFDELEIAKAINKVINDHILRENLIALGLKNVEKYDISNISEQYIKLYKDVLKG